MYQLIFADQQLWKWKEIIRTNSALGLKPAQAAGFDSFSRLPPKGMSQDHVFITILVQRRLICPSLRASSGRFLKRRERISFAWG